MLRLVNPLKAATRLVPSRHQLPLLVVGIVAALGACTPNAPESPATQAEPAPAQAGVNLLEGTTWQVISIDDEAVPAESSATLSFSADGKLAGNASCNQYFGSWSLDDAALSLTPAGATMRACEDPLMQQERRFLDTLPEIAGFEKESGGQLRLVDAQGLTRLQVAAEAPKPLDLPGTDTYGFNCGDVGRADFRYVGPDTIAFTVAGRSYVMPRERSASGARYTGDGAEFFNKGDEAMLTIGDERYECQRIAD